MNIPTWKRKSFEHFPSLTIWTSSEATAAKIAEISFWCSIESRRESDELLLFIRRRCWMKYLDLIWNEAISRLAWMLRASHVDESCCASPRIEEVLNAISQHWVALPFTEDVEWRWYSRTRHVCLRNWRNPSVHRQAPSRHPLLATRIEHCSSFTQSLPKSWAEKIKKKLLNGTRRDHVVDETVPSQFVCFFLLFSVPCVERKYLPRLGPR